MDEAHDAASNAVDIVDEQGFSKNGHLKYARRAFLLFVAVTFAASFYLRSKAEIVSNENLLTVEMDEETDLFPLLQASEHATDGLVIDRDTSDGLCFDENGTPAGLSGDLDIKPESQCVGVSFKRTNGERCPCSFVSQQLHATLHFDFRDIVLQQYPIFSIHDDYLMNY